MATIVAKRLPPFCGQDLDKPFLYNPYQSALLKARRMRTCPSCGKIAPVDSVGAFRCPACGRFEQSQLIAKKTFRRIGIVGGRRSGKTKVGAVAAREEIVVPSQLGWVCGPTSKILHDSTMPAFFKLIPPSWVKHWDGGHLDLTLVNNHLVQFRSLDDVSRGVGMGPHWAWFDEVQKIRERAWDHFRPSLTDNVGNAIFTWTPNGFDWTWRRLWRPAAELHQPGFWMAKCRTLDNPWIQRYSLDEVEEARATMTPAMFRQEYEADFVSFVGNVYDWDTIDPLTLRDDAAIKHFIPEWPAIDPSRQCVVGISAEPGAPFGAALMVPTEFGIVVAREYVSDHRSVAYNFDQVVNKMLTTRDVTGQPVNVLPARWAGDEELEFLTVEGARKGIGVMGAEHYLMTGIQRVHSWMYMRRLWFTYQTPRLLEQMRGYRWSDADTDTGEEPEHDRVFRKDTELPNALRFGLLSWPTLPEPKKSKTGRDLSKLDEGDRRQIERMEQFERSEHSEYADPLARGGGGLFGDMSDS